LDARALRLKTRSSKANSVSSFLFEDCARELDNAVIRVHFQRSGSDYRVVEMGFPRDYVLEK